MEKMRPGLESKSRNLDLPEKIRNIDLGSISFKLSQPTSPVQWTNEQMNLVEEEYRKFLALRFLNPDKIIVPDGAIDVFWHQHILDTEKYALDCNEIFGEFIHHFPYFGLRGEEDKNNLVNSFQETIDLYKNTFGNPPENMWEMAADCGRLGCCPGPTH